MLFQKWLFSFLLLTFSLQGSCDDTEFGLGTYGWFPWIEQTLTIGQTTAKINASLVDLIQESDQFIPIIFAGTIDKEKLGGHLDFIYLSLNFNDNPTQDPNLLVDLEASTVYFEAAGHYRLFEYSDYVDRCCLLKAYTISLK